MSMNKGKIAVSSMARLITMQSVINAPVRLERLSQKGMSVSYLEQIFSVLRKAGLVVSTRGPGGGYTVASSGVTVGDVLRVFVTDGFMLMPPVLRALDRVSITELQEVKL